MQRDYGAGPPERRPRAGRSGWRKWVTSVPHLLLTVVVVVGDGFLAGYLFSVVAIFPPQKAATNLREVPELVGQTAEGARRALERAGLGYLEAASLHHPASPGSVVAQDPLPGQVAPPGSPVHVTLSLGPNERPVPDVLGLNYRQAEVALGRAGFESDLSWVDAEADVGQVVGTRPEPSTPMRLPGHVRLLVSAGPPRVAAPDLVTRSLAEARAALERVGLRLGDVRQDSTSLAAPGTVIRQRPRAGKVVARATRISVTVATVPPLAPADTAQNGTRDEG